MSEEKKPTFNEIKKAIEFFKNVGNKTKYEKALWQSSKNGTYVKKNHGELK